MTGNQWQQTRDDGSKQWISGLVCLICALLGMDTVASIKRDLFSLNCVYVLDRSSLGLLVGVFLNFYSDLEITLRMETLQFLLPSCASSPQFPRCPLPDLPRFESNHQCPIGCSDHVTYIGHKSTAFLYWWRIFPWELPTEPVSVQVRLCECACVCVLGTPSPPPPPPPPSPLPLFPTSSPYPPFSPLFSTTSHPLKHSITL